MFQGPPRERMWVSWLMAAAWTGCILSAIPFARAMQGWVGAHWGTAILRWFSMAVILLAATFAAVYLWRRLRLPPWRNIFWLAATVGVFMYLCMARMKTPSEALHFLEYGFLGMLVFRALSHRLHDRLIYFCAILACLLVGTCDEILQWLTPGRYWDIRDIGHNGTAAALAQVALAGGLRPPFIRPGVSPLSVRWFCALAALQLLLLGFCFSNTPVAVEWYTEKLPRLEFLRENDSPMSEYGFRHDDPDIGRFYSRFGKDDLLWIDSRRGQDAGTVVGYYLTEGSYSNFLRRYTPAVDAFVHEAMVHAYRRDHYYAVLWKYKGDDDLYRRHATVAYRENKILEKYFPQTLRASGQAWPAEQAAALVPFLRVDRRYKSEVSRHLITHVRERDLWRLIMVFLALDLAFLIWRGRSRDPEGRPHDPVPA